MPYRCKDCRAHFSVKTGTVMQRSNLGLQKWAIALYMMTTGIKGKSSMKLYREVGIRQATAWFLMQRIREGFMGGSDKPLPDPVKADETAAGGKRENVHANKQKHLTDCGGTATAIVAGVKGRDSRQVSAVVVKRASAATLRKLVIERTQSTATVYADEVTTYSGLPRGRESVNHSVGKYVRAEATVIGMKAFWSLIKRGYQAAFHRRSDKHLDRYVAEYVRRNNIHDMDTLNQIAIFARAVVGKRPRYAESVT